MAGLDELNELFGSIGAKPEVVKDLIKLSVQPLTITNDRLKAIDDLSAELDKKFGNTGTIKRLGDRVGKPLPSISTDIYTLDWDVLQCGGIPKGRIIEIFGPNSAGKTTLTLHIIACAQREGGLAAFVDAEHALDPNYATLLGVDVPNLLVTQPDSGEEALETVLGLVESGAVSIVVVDSVAALTPRAELEGDMGDVHMGLQARMMSQGMRKLTAAVAKSGVVVIFINQIRDKIGVMFGSPETTTGGKALLFYASVRLDVRRRKLEGEKDRPTGHWLEVKAAKNKVGAPFRSTEIFLDYQKGIDTFGDLVQYGVNKGVIDKSGSWLSFQGERLGQGTDKAGQLLASSPQLVIRIKEALKSK